MQRYIFLFKLEIVNRYLIFNKKILPLQFSFMLKIILPYISWRKLL